MPTENRSGNTEMVSVKRELVGQAMQACFEAGFGIPHDALRDVLAQPAQHQGEPVALPTRKAHHLDPSFLPDGDKGWNACLDEVAKLGPLYTHPAPADPGEVERLRNRMLACEEIAENNAKAFAEALTKLAERDALLGELLEYAELGWDFVPDISVKVRNVLSAVAEPIAPTPTPAYMEAACDKFDWTPEEALRFYAESRHFDTDNGRTRILCTGAIASHALKGMSKKYADLKGSEQSAAVERDDQQDLRDNLNRMIGQAEYMLELAENSADPEEDEDDGSFDECRKYIEQARAALERKPQVKS